MSDIRMLCSIMVNQKDKLHIEFGTPEYGWLPTIFIYGDFKLKLDISDVPLNPIVQLCASLIQITKGIKFPDRIIWHLEPYCYYLQLEKTDKEYRAIILESDDFDSPTKISKEISGDFETIILPLYRGLKKFWLQSFKPPQWEETPSERIEELTVLIKEKKEHNKVDK